MNLFFTCRVDLFGGFSIARRHSFPRLCRCRLFAFAACRLRPFAVVELGGFFFVLDANQVEVIRLIIGAATGRALGHRLTQPLLRGDAVICGFLVNRRKLLLRGLVDVSEPLPGVLFDGGEPLPGGGFRPGTLTSALLFELQQLGLRVDGFRAFAPVRRHRIVVLLLEFGALGRRGARRHHLRAFCGS